MILGALGPYPERINTFLEDGHQVWYVSTEEPLRSSYPGLIGRCHLWDLAVDPSDAVHRLIDLIVHLYGMFRRMRADGRMMDSEDVRDRYRDLALSNYLHLHDSVPPGRFVEEWSLIFLSPIQFIETRYHRPIRFAGRLRRAGMGSDDVAHCQDTD
jgi:hypothetical protein